MEWFSQNWVWVLFFVGMIAMHLFGHGGHGGHGRHTDRTDDAEPAKKDSDLRDSAPAPTHKH